MNNVNSSVSTQLTNKKRPTKAQLPPLIANIIKNKGMQDIYEFMKEESWKDYDCNSLTECINKYPGLPAYSTMLRHYKMVEYQLMYLPGTKIGDFKRSVFRTICEGKLSDKIKARVAAKILNSNKEFQELTTNDIEKFIMNSKVVLNQRHMDAALNFAEDIITEKYLDKIEEYIEKHNLSMEKQKVFFREIGRCFWKELEKSFE